MKRVLMACALLIVLSATAFAGEYYLSDEDGYWWYWDGSPAYEVKIPATAFAYVQVEWGGATSLEVALGEKGPLLLIGTLPGTDVNRAWNAISGRWAASVENSRMTNDSTITTDQGLSARFRVLEGSAPGGPNAMVRMVMFTRGNRTAYLAFVGNASSYAGAVREHWLKAVHTFNWR